MTLCAAELRKDPGARTNVFEILCRADMTYAGELTDNDLENAEIRRLDLYSRMHELVPEHSRFDTALKALEKIPEGYHIRFLDICDNELKKNGKRKNIFDLITQVRNDEFLIL